jgi:hypothetical protein
MQLSVATTMVADNACKTFIADQKRATIKVASNHLETAATAEADLRQNLQHC